MVVVTGETGCGKTTQVPQFIMEELSGECFIVCTQPRRISAIGVASRVAEERGENIDGDRRVISDCHFRKTATEYDRKPGIKWLSCTAK